MPPGAQPRTPVSIADRKAAVEEQRQNRKESVLNRHLVSQYTSYLQALQKIDELTIQVDTLTSQVAAKDVQLAALGKSAEAAPAEVVKP